MRRSFRGHLDIPSLPEMVVGQIMIFIDEDQFKTLKVEAKSENSQLMWFLITALEWVGTLTDPRGTN